MHLMQSAPGPETIVDGRKYLYFCGTGYLGLQGHPDLIRAACDATQRWGLGTATTRASWGNAAPIIEVEQNAARFWDCESAFYFASGYLGNQALLASLATPSSTIFVDERSHYSVMDASRLFDVPVFRFAHRDAQSLDRALADHLRPKQVPVVMSDGVFTATGSIAPVADYIDVIERFEGAVLCLDDCHAVGVLGERGRGTYEHIGISQSAVNVARDGNDGGAPRLFAAATLSKAFGGHGGIIYGSRSFVERVKRSSHIYRGASAPSIPAAAASAAALRLVTRTPQLIAQVQQNALLLRHGLRDLGLDVDRSPVPIVGLVLGSAQNMEQIQRKLAEEGILIAYLQKYSGLDERGSLRIATFATHTDEMIQSLIESLKRHL